MAFRTFRSFIAAVSPTVLRGFYGQRLGGAIALLKDYVAEACRQAVRASWIGDTPGNGPAYDALSPAGNELSLPRYPVETWPQYHARLQRAWSDWPFAGHETSILGQLTAAGWPGAEIQYVEDFPGYENWWSQFVLFFPFGTHPVTGAPEYGGFIWGDGTFWGVVGLSFVEMQTIRGIVRKFKPGHWVCRAIGFELSPGGDVIYIGV